MCWYFCISIYTKVYLRNSSRAHGITLFGDETGSKFMVLLHDSSEKIVHCLAWCAIMTTDPTVRSLALLPVLGRFGFSSAMPSCLAWPVYRLGLRSQVPDFYLRRPQHSPGAYLRHPETPKWKEFRNINSWLGVWGMFLSGMLENA